MAAASLTVSTSLNGYREWRVFGGNRSDVKWMKKKYETASYDWISAKHPEMTLEAWKTMGLYLNLNKG